MASIFPNSSMALSSLLASSSSCTASSPTIALGRRVSGARLSQCLSVFSPSSVRRIAPVASKAPQQNQHIVPLSQQIGRPQDILLLSDCAKEQSYTIYTSAFTTSTKASMQTGSGSSEDSVSSLGEQAKFTGLPLTDIGVVKGMETRDVAMDRSRGITSWTNDGKIYFYLHGSDYVHHVTLELEYVAAAPINGQPADYNPNLQILANSITMPGHTKHTENEPYKVLTETERQGPVPPGGNNIKLGYVDNQRSLKMVLKKEKLKVLLIGESKIGTKIAEVLVQSGYTTSAYVTDTTPSDPSNSWIVQKYKDMGVDLIQGDLDNHESLLKAVKAVDVVISVVGYAELTDQIKIIDAIKEAGNIKKFIITAEFVNDAKPGHVADPALMYENMAQLKQNVETAKIPYTFISYNFAAGPFFPYLGLGGINTAGLPADNVTISDEAEDLEDVAILTVKSIVDYSRTIIIVLKKV